MKKIFLFLTLLPFIGCSDEMNDFKENCEVENVIMTVKNFEWDNKDARTSFDITPDGAIFKWAKNDTIGIFPNEGAQVYFPIKEGSNSNSATFNGGGWALKPSSTYAAYYPFVKSFDVTMNDIPVSYIGQCQDGNGSTAHLGKYDFMIASAESPKEGSAFFSFEHLGCLVKLDIRNNKSMDLTSIEVVAQKAFPLEGHMNIIDKSIKMDASPKTLVVDLKNIKSSKGNVSTIYFMMPPVDLSGQYINVVVSGTNGFEQVLEFQGTNFKSGKAYDLNKLDKTLEKIYHVDIPGTLKNLVDKNIKYSITSLIISGNLNCDDMIIIRDMLGLGLDYEHPQTAGHLSSLDISNVNFVDDYQSYYYDDGDLEGDLYGEPCSTSAKTIGRQMFQRAYNLFNLKLPTNATRILSHALDGCCELRNLALPPNLFKISCYVFVNCPHLKSIKLPASVGQIYFPTFSENIESIYIPSPEVVWTMYQSDFETEGYDEYNIGSTTANIYVPANLVNAYFQDEFWGKMHKTQIKAIP